MAYTTPRTCTVSFVDLNAHERDAWIKHLCWVPPRTRSSRNISVVNLGVGSREEHTVRGVDLVEFHGARMRAGHIAFTDPSIKTRCRLQRRKLVCRLVGKKSRRA